MVDEKTAFSFSDLEEGGLGSWYMAGPAYMTQ